MGLDERIRAARERVAELQSGAAKSRDGLIPGAQTELTRTSGWLEGVRCGQHHERERIVQALHDRADAALVPTARTYYRVVADFIARLPVSDAERPGDGET